MKTLIMTIIIGALAVFALAAVLCAIDSTNNDIHRDDLKDLYEGKGEEE